MVKIDEKKLDELSELQVEVIEKVKKLENLQRTLTSQEQAVSGGWAFLVRNVWTSEEYTFLGGDINTVKTLIEKALVYLIQGAREVKDIIITPPDKGNGGMMN